MQGILLTRYCQVKVISIITEKLQEEEQAGCLVAIARYRLVHMHRSILLVATPGRDLLLLLDNFRLIAQYWYLIDVWVCAMRLKSSYGFVI